MLRHLDNPNRDSNITPAYAESEASSGSTVIGIGDSNATEYIDMIHKEDNFHMHEI